MTPQEINIAIAEWCGWRLSNIAQRVNVGFEGYDNYFWRSPSGFAEKSPPDYYHDLNAVRVAWLKLVAYQRAKFSEELAYIVLAAPNNPNNEFIFSRCSLAVFANATAPQRCEALLRTVGKWKEDVK